MEPRFIANDFASGVPRLSGDAQTRLRDCLEKITGSFKPTRGYPAEVLKGVASGPTGIAYLFLHVDSSFPHLKIRGHHANTWVKRYMAGSRYQTQLKAGSCGIMSEPMCARAVMAAYSGLPRDIMHFLSAIPAIVSGDFPNELLYGRAGALYLLRMVRHWAPDHAPSLDRAIHQVSMKIMEDGPDWSWHGKQYVGAAHGDFGIITQLVLSNPALALQLEGKLSELLDMQLPDGNWPSSVGKTSSALVQFCHGAPGVVQALLSLKPYYARLEERLDAAVERARACVWGKGILRKEPSLCHGLWGNALVLPSGNQRDYFLALATPEAMEELMSRDESIFEPSSYGANCSLLMTYLPGAAWAWMVMDEKVPRSILFNDV